MTLGSVFWRTFAQLFAPYVGAAMLVDWVTDYRLGITQLVIGLVMAVLGGLIAVLVALRVGFADTALGKALRSGAESLIVVLSAIVVNSLADLVALPRLLIPGVIAAVGAFALTWLQNQGLARPPEPQIQ